MALAAPVEKDGFSYAGDSFYCEASNLNRHRRATLPELKAHFSGKDENRPAHWYEAQLLHYGLPPSKVKGTAHKRLFDAVMKGGLSVPPHIQKIEADLKKDWAKREREAKKVLKESAAATSSSKGTKRKADQPSTNLSFNVNVNFSGSGPFEIQTTQSPAKKIKTAKSTPSKTSAQKKTTTTTAKASKIIAKTLSSSKAAKPAAKPAPKPKEKKATAVKTTKALAKASSPLKATKSTVKPKEKKATVAKTTKPKPKASTNLTSQQASSLNSYAAGSFSYGYDDSPPPYSEYNDYY